MQHTKSKPPAGPKIETLRAVLIQLYRTLSHQRRRGLLPLLILMVVGALAEVFTLGSLLPFLAAISDPEGSPILAPIRPLLEHMGAESPLEVLYILTALFAVVAIGAALLRLVLLWFSQKYVFGIAYEIAVKLYSDTLSQPYEYHTQRNTSEIIASINKVQLVTGEVLLPLMHAAVAAVIAAFIVAGLVAIDPVVALASGAGFAAIYLAVSVTSRRGFRRNGAVIAQAQGTRVQAMQEGLGGIRDILIDRSQPVFVETYERAERGLRDARIRNVFFALAPRYVVEAAGMVLIAVIAVAVVSRPGGIFAAVPVLGALALGAQRLLPLVQQIYAGWAQATGNMQNLRDLVALLHRPAPVEADADLALPFERKIVLDGVGFSYAGGNGRTLHDVSLEIPRGARVGIAGKTGSGKSTLTDVIIGLLAPTSGTITVDGAVLTAANRAAWRKNIAHVPQSIFLADASVAENIAFGVKKDEIDHERVRRAAEQAELADVIAAMPDGYSTRVGERGMQLSGGQRQRIGIARALYKQASVLVFDEATSALDTETETAVMAAIERLERHLTILIIAHRLSTLEGCEMVVRLVEGQVVKGGRVGSHEFASGVSNDWCFEEDTGPFA